MPFDSTICFEDAHIKHRERKIRDAEYFRHVIAHFRGVRHPPDAKPTKKVPSSTYGWPFTHYAISKAALAKDYKLLSAHATTALEKIFQACSSGDVKRLESLLHAITTNEGVPAKLFIQPLAVLAIEKDRTESFRFCSDQGANLKDPWLSAAIEKLYVYSRSLEMIELLYERKWKRMANSATFRSELATKLIRSPRPGIAPCIQWLLDRGAKLRKKDIRYAILSTRLDEDLIAILIAADREAATRFGSVRTAVTNGNPEVVRQLLEAGASPNYPGGVIADEREGTMDSPLIEVITPSQMADPYSPGNVKPRLAIARILLEHGASLEVRGIRGDTAVQRVNLNGGKLFIDLFEEFGAYSEDHPAH